MIFLYCQLLLDLLELLNIVAYYSVCFNVPNYDSTTKLFDISLCITGMTTNTPSTWNANRRDGLAFSMSLFCKEPFSFRLTFCVISQAITGNYHLCYYDTKYGKQPSSTLTNTNSE